MSVCTSPLIKAELNTVHLTKKGKLTPDVEFLDRDSYDKGLYNNLIGVGNKYKRIYPIACQQCINCRLNYARDRATQIMLEVGEYPEEECWFITVTYNDDFIPYHSTKYYDEEIEEWVTTTGQSLDQKNAQKFFWKMRKHFKKVKKVYCGEYGSQTHRPHGHAILMGCKLDLTRLEKYTVNEWGDPIWRCKELEEKCWSWKDADGKKWSKGNIYVGRVTWETCSYVARYTLKKSLSASTNEEYSMWYKMHGKRPEYIEWSNGIGRSYFERNMTTIYDLDQVPIINKKTGLPVKPPKSYDRILEQIDPKLHKSITEKRQYQAEIQNKLTQMQDTLSPEERRAISEARMKQVMQDFRERSI